MFSALLRFLDIDLKFHISSVFLQCAEENHIGELEAIITCANGTEGDTLLVEMGNLTQMLQPKLSSVPTVVFNNVSLECILSIVNIFSFFPLLLVL